MHVTEKRHRLDIVKSRRLNVADMHSSSDPIALHDSAFVPDTYDTGRRKDATKDSSSDDLNIGATRGRNQRRSMRNGDPRLHPYSPPGFFTDVNLQSRDPYGMQGKGIGKIGARREPIPIPRPSSQIKEELQLARDASLELSSADDDFSTVMGGSEAEEEDTVRGRLSRSRSDNGGKASSFDQLRLQHPFSDRSWRNSGFELEVFPPGLKDKDSSEDIGSGTGVGYKVTQSWRQDLKPSLDASSATQGNKDDHGSSEPDLDATDSPTTIESFALEYPRSAAPYFSGPSASLFGMTNDSLSDYEHVRHATRERPTPCDMADISLYLTSLRSSSFETSSSDQGESTPLTEYAVTQTVFRSVNPSFILRTGEESTLHTGNTSTSPKVVRLDPASSRVTGGSTPLTAFQVTQNTASSRKFSTHRLVTSTPLSNYAAVSAIDVLKRGNGDAGEQRFARPIDSRRGVAANVSDHLADTGDSSIEYGRDAPATRGDGDLVSVARSASYEGTPEPLPKLHCSRSNASMELLPGSTAQHHPQDPDPSVQEVLLDPAAQAESAFAHPIRRKPRRHTEATHGTKKQARRGTLPIDEQPVSLHASRCPTI